MERCLAYHSRRELTSRIATFEFKAVLAMLVRNLEFEDSGARIVSKVSARVIFPPCFLAIFSSHFVAERVRARTSLTPLLPLFLVHTADSDNPSQISPTRQPIIDGKAGELPIRVSMASP